MPKLTDLAIQGFRAISEPVELHNLQPYVSLHGDNAVGKSSIAGAIELIHRLVAELPNEISRLGTPWHAHLFHEHFGTDAWIFNQRSGNRIRLTASWTRGFRVEFVLDLGEDEKISWTIVDADRGNDIISTFLRSFSYRHNDEQEEWTRGVALAVLEAQRMAADLGAARYLPPPQLPVPQQLRELWGTAWSGIAPSARGRARSLSKVFSEAFPSLENGRLEPIDNPYSRTRDVAWVDDDGRVVPLDQLGGGVQSAFSTLSRAALSDARILAVEEPEAFVGQAAALVFAEALRATVSEGWTDQLWLTTHSVNLASGQIFVVERDKGITTARLVGRAELAPYIAELSPARAGTSLRMSHDGSIRLLAYIVEDLNIKPGDPVFFLRASEGGYRVVNYETWSAAFDSSDPIEDEIDL
jgi:hypothetical protein